MRDANFRKSLRYRNIYINDEDPPEELMRRAKRIITRPRKSSEMDDVTARKLKDTVRRLESRGEETNIEALVSDVVPSENKVADPRLARSKNQLWCDTVPIPLDPDVLVEPDPPRLQRPKPDLVFGYSRAAFSHKQLASIDLLIDKDGRSYAVPDRITRFPFLDVEFKSQAKGGSHFIATNQVANAGSTATNGGLELIRRISGVVEPDQTEPQFFSLSTDHALACVNVHWLSTNAENGQFSFHVEGLSKQCFG